MDRWDRGEKERDLDPPLPLGWLRTWGHPQTKGCPCIVEDRRWIHWKEGFWDASRVILEESRERETTSIPSLGKVPPRYPSSIPVAFPRRKMYLSATRVSFTKTKAKKWNTNATRSSLTMPKFPPTISMPQFPVFPTLPWQKNDRRDDELVDSLLELVEGSDCGADMSEEKRSQVVDAVEKLLGGGVKKPARSKLLEARYDVVYTDNAVAAGGPFRTAPGRAIFWTDAITQVIEEGNLFNRVDFHLLGLVPGAVTLDAQVDILSDDRLRARFDRPKLELAGKTFQFGKESATEQEVLYLDERIRISRGLSSKASLLIFKKIT